MRRFTLVANRWYACEFIGDEFLEDKTSYSPIRVERVEAAGDGSRNFRLSFYHANYPEGVQGKQYSLQMIERGATYLLAKSSEHQPPRFLQIYEIDVAWIARHFPRYQPPKDDIQLWLERHG